LVVHAVRVLGYATTSRVAERTGLKEITVGELLLGAQAVGQVAWTEFADQGGWSLTDLARAAEGLAGIEGRLAAGLARFGGYHERFTAAMERAWQDTA
jgi:hypothetical protein